ncbi:MAG: Gfo/Idh/MocA family oxidoreductase, partial [Bacteroidota bacterium]
MKKIQFVVVGYGRIGKRHATMVQENPASELVAVVDVDTSLSADVDAGFGVPFFTRVDDFLSSGLSADVVSVCTPNHLHASICIQAMDAGFHVICEKPMALKKSDCEAMIERSLKLGKLVFVVMQNRYSPPSRWLKEMVDSGRLGQLYHIQINCFWNRDERYYSTSPWKGKLDMDGGTLFTQFSHYVDMMYWLFGDVTNAHASFRNFNHEGQTDFEDSGAIMFDFL